MKTARKDARTPVKEDISPVSVPSGTITILSDERRLIQLRRSRGSNPARRLSIEGSKRIDIALSKNNISPSSSDVEEVAGWAKREK